MARRRTRDKHPGSGPGSYGKASTDAWIEDAGLVIRLLHDDAERHQRFVVRLAGGQTLLVAHNLDLAERVPIGIGDRVGFRGIFEWNASGGILHWTHRDPRGDTECGYVRFRGRLYQ